jgi:predicted extracellular nuclease
MATTLVLGDIALVGVGADTGVKSLAFVTLIALEEGTVINFTDNGWLAAGGFRSGEGVVSYTVPAGGIPAGTVITITGLTGSLNPAVGGDQIIVYQGAAATPTILFAIDFADGNTTYAGDATNANTSAVPTGLTFGTNALAFGTDNVGYTGTTTGTRAEILAAIADETNWTTNDTAGVTYPTSFTVNSDGSSTVSINDVSITEGDSGTQILTFTVTRSNDDGAFTVDYATADNSATVAANDYESANGTLTFAAESGILTQTVSVTINGDIDIELDESFFVNLSNVVNTTGTAIVTDAQGVGTITTDDFPPTVSIGDVSVAEGDAGTSLLTFTVTRTEEDSAFTLDFNTVVGGSATAGVDYEVVSGGTITFTQGGPLTQTVSVTINGDVTVEGDETFNVEISNIQNTVGTTTIADGAATGTILNDDVTKIYDIQGENHLSTFDGQVVTTIGVVTAIDKDNNAYWIQDPDGDGNRNTSDGIYVFVGGALPSSIVVGNLIRVSGTVDEFQPGGTANLSLTEIVSVTETTLLQAGYGLPTAVTIGDTANGADYTPPTVELGSATNGFDPTTEGVDFWESLEGMLVTLQDVRTTTPFKSSFGEVMVTMDVGDNDSANGRGGLTISDESADGVLPVDKTFDFNPERIQLDDEALGGSIGAITSVGQTVVGGDVTGVVSYGQGFYDVNVTQAVTFDASTLTREVTTIEETFDRLTVATFNVRNLAPIGFNGGDGVTTQTTLDNLADAIGTNLKTPDIIGLQELQDFNGTSTTGDGDATLTMTQLIDTIFARTGVQYYGILSDPVDGGEGGASGGNIQVAFLYQADAVTPTAGNGLVATSNPYIFKFPTADRIGTDNTDFSATRKSIPIEFTPAGYTETEGGSFWVINNHFSSKGGSAVLIGSNLDSEYYAEPLNSDSVKREGQAIAVKAFIDGILADANPLNDKVIALGDFNDFQIFPVIEIITGEIERLAAGVGNTPSTFVTGTQVLEALINLLPPEERYSYNFDGNAQALDNIIATLDLLVGAQYDIIHINSEFATQLSDHDPGLASLVFDRSAALAGDGDDLLTEAAYIAHFGAVRGSMAGDDIIYARGGNDLIEGSEGADYIDGGDGIDTVDYSGSSIAVNVNLAAGTVSGGFGDGDTLISIEYVIGSGGADVFNGDAGANILDGGAGADILTGLAGNDSYYVDDAGDQLIESSGIDTVFASIDYTLVNADNPALTGVFEKLVLTGTADIDGTGNTLSNHITGNSGSNVLTGGVGSDSLWGMDGADQLVGGTGNDILDGGAGDDVMEGGADSDTYLVDSAGDVIIDSSGHDIVRSTAAAYTLGVGVEVLFLDGAAVSGTGNAVANTITGNALANLLDGAIGTDVLNGGDGDDTLDGGADSDRLYGGAGADDLIGGLGADILDGGADADEMAGGVGNDIYYVDNAGDSVIEAAGQGQDFVYVTGSALTLGAGSEIEQIRITSAGATVTASDTANRIYGGAGADTIIAMAGADFIDGGAGDDVMNGGLGNDNFVVDSFLDEVIEAVGEGADTVLTVLDGYVLAANVENLNLTGTGNQDGSGNDLANNMVGTDFNNSLDGGRGADRLFGNGGADDLYGGGDNDYLNGGSGDDFLYAGDGNDIMIGGIGRDYFEAADVIRALLPAEGTPLDTIADYEAGETIGLGITELNFQSVFDGTAFQARLTYNSSNNTTMFQLDVDGDNKVDYSLRINGDQTANTAIVDQPDAVGGGWYLFG